MVLVRVPDVPTGIQQVFTPYESLGLGYIAAYLRQHGHRVEIVDGSLMDVGEDLVHSLDDDLKGLMADEYIRAVSRSRYGELAPHELAWIVQKAQLGQAVMRAAPDLVGFTVPSATVCERVSECAGLLRRLGLRAPVCAGGAHASLYDADLLADVAALDACVRGEGEETVLELADECTTRGNWHGIGGLSWRDGEDLVRNEPRPLITDLDVLPFPARDHLPEVLRRGGGVVISGSRGCWGQCSFCSIREFYGARGEERWRGRSPRNVVEEMKLLHATYGADRYWFVDDEFFCAGSRGRQRAEAIFQQVIEEGLAVRFDIFCRAEDFAVGRRDGVLDLGVRAGLRRALIGIESGSAKVLKRYRKGLSPAVNRKAVVEGEALGIDVRVEFIMLDPWSTLSEVEANLAFLRQLPSATGIGKADPVILSSKLYIHRETDLGRRFLAEMCLPVESPPTATTKYPVPYEFRDPRVVALDHIISHAWGHFAPVLQVLERLDRLVDRLSVPPLLEKSEFDRRKEVAREHEVRRRGLQRVLDEQALAFFEEALAFVRHFDLKGRTQEERDARQDALDDEVYGVSRRMAFEAENVATYVYSLAVPALGAAWDALCHLGLQYDGERPPDELGALV